MKSKSIKTIPRYLPVVISPESPCSDDMTEANENPSRRQSPSEFSPCSVHRLSKSISKLKNGVKIQRCVCEEGSLWEGGKGGFLFPFSNAKRGFYLKSIFLFFLRNQLVYTRIKMKLAKYTNTGHDTVIFLIFHYYPYKLNNL